MAVSEKKPNPFPKKLVVGCDGTWMDSDNGFQKDIRGGHLVTPSNVTRIQRSLSHASKPDGPGKAPMPQIRYYQAGVGSSYNFSDNIAGGGFGAGISEHIRAAYGFLANNWQPGDEIYLIGFSRGSFTARSVAAFVDAVGLLTEKGMYHFYSIFEDWENQVQSDYEPRADEGLPFASIEDRKGLIYAKMKGYKKTLRDNGFTMKEDLQAVSNDFSFVNTKVPSVVDHAIQALALDENRSPFQACVWEKTKDEDAPPEQTLKQVWFPGAHSDVGGGYSDTSSADLSLAWMMSELVAVGLSFDIDYFKEQYIANNKKATEAQGSTWGGEDRYWGCGLIHNSLSPFYKIAGHMDRTPMGYLERDDVTARLKEPPVPLQNTNEQVHASVRVRMARALNNKFHLGIEGKGPYKTTALEKWSVSGMEKGAAGKELPGLEEIRKAQGNIKWSSTDGKQMKEAPLGPLELELLKLSPTMSKEFLSIG